MKFVIILILYTIYMTCLSQDFINGPLLVAYPCANTKDVVIWYDPSLPAKEKNRYYLYIKTPIHANSTVRVEFDENVIVTYNFHTDLGKFVKVSMSGDITVFQVYTEFAKFSFTVNGMVPGSIAYVTSIIINDREICTEPNEYYFDRYLIDSWDSGPQNNCGRTKVKHENTPIGIQSKPKRGDWPWHSAIFKSDDTIKKYICGGTLVSKTFVLTAAHCVTRIGVPLLPEILSVLFGKIDLRKKHMNKFEKEVHRVIVHQNFEYRYLDNDIALLKLKDEVTYGRYIQPACLWYYKASDKFSSKFISGTVVGWGSKKRINTHNLHRTDIPMVPFTTCMSSDLVFYASFISDESKFCAGFLNGTTIYNGDSGGAFQVFLPDEDSDGNDTGAFYVRGVVSQTLSKTDHNIQDYNQFVIFTNLVSYRSWIDAYIQEDDY